MQGTRGDFANLLAYLHPESSRQTFSLNEAERLINERAHRGKAFKILDLGCGAGESSELKKVHDMIQWFGLDIADSFEVLNRGDVPLVLCTFDGVNIPFRAESIDLVYSHQVFEHVRNPSTLLSEVFRVLKPNGSLIGSTSHLEPYHSSSYWNYTPYGFATLLKDCGFKGISLRPGIDGLTLTARRLCSFLKMSSLFQPFFRNESPLNLAIEALRVLGVNARKRNALKLLFCGHFVFEASKMESSRT